MRPLLAAAALALLLPVPAAQAANPWLERRIINMTHQGGENEHPSGTMFALRESLGLGADTLELDVQPTKDGTLMVLHDQSVERTTGLAKSVYDLTTEETQRLDAAYNFVPGRGTVPDAKAEEHTLRGIRTGERKPPLGYTPDDFRIPTLDEVLTAFPGVGVNIEIKGRADSDSESFLRNADLLVALLKRHPEADAIVVSFQQDAVDRFHAAMPAVPVAPGITGVAAFYATSMAPAGTAALQVPPNLSGVPIMSTDFVARAHRSGLAVHVWFSGQEESERVYNSMLDMGADGLMPAKPRALERVLCQRRVSRLPGNPNHCFGGPHEAAGHCAPKATAVSRVRKDRTVTLTIRRAEERIDYACTGKVTLRRRSAEFKFPYGVRETKVVVKVPRRARGAAVAATRVDGQSRDRKRRFTLRGR